MPAVGDDQGLPSRAQPYLPQPFGWALSKLAPHPEVDAEVFGFVLDTGCSRTVTYWSREELAGLMKIVGETLGGLQTANDRDLALLRDVTNGTREQ